MLMKYVLCMYEHEYVEEILPCAGGACVSYWFAAWPYFGNFTIRVYSAPYHTVRPIMSRRQKFIEFIFIHIHVWAFVELKPAFVILTCSCAHAPWGQAVWCGEAVEHADILRSQELHKLGVVEHFPLAVQDGCCLVRDVNNLPRDERHCYSEYILKAKTKRY